MPDFIYIEPTPDAPMVYESTADLVTGDRFFCHGMSYDYRKPHSISNAATSIMPAGKKLAGLETTVCVREDPEKDRYAKAYLAYRPNPKFIGDEYRIGAYAHLKNKREADKLLDQIVRSFKLLPLD